MVATQTVPQLSPSGNSALAPRHGVLTLFGYGITVRVDRGHLVVKDGIGPVHREARFPRVGHGLRRLVVIGSDGFVSLGALRWLADQDAAFVMLERDGSVLATTGPALRRTPPPRPDPRASVRGCLTNCARVDRPETGSTRETRPRRLEQ